MTCVVVFGWCFVACVSVGVGCFVVRRFVGVGGFDSVLSLARLLFLSGRPHCRGLCIALFRGPITVGSVISGSVSNFACDSACSLVHSGTPCRPRFGGPARLRLPSSAPRPLGATFSSLWVGRGRPLSAALPGFSGQGGGLHAVQGDGFGWTDIVFVLSALARERRCPFIYIYIYAYIYISIKTHDTCDCEAPPPTICDADAKNMCVGDCSSCEARLEV